MIFFGAVKLTKTRVRSLVLPKSVRLLIYALNNWATQREHHPAHPSKFHSDRATRCM